MNKKGFTLIELLAVIVILAIIALIATPIILNIINDAKKESNERSVEMYASAVKNAIATYQLKEGKAPTTFDDIKDSIQYDGATIECAEEELYKDGNVYLSGCTANGVEVDYTYGTQQEVLVKLSDVCTAVTTPTTGNVPSGSYTIGDEYNCEVAPGKNYTFFVLSTVDNKVNLIMDSNVNANGEPIKETNPTDKGLVAWLSKEDFDNIGGEIPDELLNEVPCQMSGNCVSTEYGPLTAIEYLNRATSSWSNLSSIVETYEDEGRNYDSIKLTGHARMPKKSEVLNDVCSGSLGGCPLWMVNYLSLDESYYSNFSSVSGVGSYWLLSSGSVGMANYITNVGHVGNLYPFSTYGVRPVITLEI